MIKWFVIFLYILPLAACASAPSEESSPSTSNVQSPSHPAGFSGTYVDPETETVVRYRSTYHQSGVTTFDTNVNGKGISMVIDNRGRIREIVGQTQALTYEEKLSLSRASDQIALRLQRASDVGAHERSAIQEAALALANME